MKCCTVVVIVATLVTLAGEAFAVDTVPPETSPPMPQTSMVAGERVKFHSASAKPSALRKRLAEAKGQKLEEIPRVALDGYLLKPEGAGPFPAAVLMHGCAGIIPSIDGVWAERLRDWGYATLLVDSFATRGFRAGG